MYSCFLSFLAPEFHSLSVSLKSISLKIVSLKIPAQATGIAP
jgi:hypothetical protein